MNINTYIFYKNLSKLNKNYYNLIIIIIMSDTSSLFIQTSQILRDETIISLQKENTILRTMLKKNTSLIGTKVKILPFNGTYMGDFDVSEETEGYIIQEISTHFKIKILIIDENNLGKIVDVPYKYIRFENADKLFN